MPVEMNPDVESASLSIWEGEKREEVKALPSPEVPAEQAKAALEKKAAETQLQPNIQSLFNYFKIPEMPEASATSLILMSEEKLTQVLEPILDYAIDGSSYELGEQVPASLANWVPSTTIESTNSRRDRYLREYQGDQKAATEAAIAR